MRNFYSSSDESNRSGKISRRNFIIIAASGIGAITLALGKLLSNLKEQSSMLPTPEPGLSPTTSPESEPNPSSTSEQNVTSEITPTSEDPAPEPTLDVQEPSEGRPRVVHVRNNHATFWDFSTGWYGDHVDQNVVDGMVEDGLRVLTGKEALPAAWAVLFQRVNEVSYKPGEKIAIKINLNNVRDCSENSNAINALPQTIIGLIRTLKIAGVQEEDIWVYDATVVGRYIPDRIRNSILNQYPNIEFYGRGSCSGVNQVVYSQTDPSLRIQFSDTNGYLSDRWLPDLLGQASYLINMPILKYHGIHPVSLGFKNHFGSLNNIMRAGADNLHEYINPKSSYYSPEYSPLVALNNNVHIRDKTILVFGDALFGSRNGATQAPVPWNTFDNTVPNSLIMGIDPVAVDCVMVDFVNAEKNMGMDGAYDYLYCAEETGLGKCEGTRDSPGGESWIRKPNRAYSSLDYLLIEN